ncbi:MAG TPA: YceI family protein [Gemmatimonas sp.]|uniref:YceI family protein n=1 Tax=Gemmatimonas sp. TaxID=1962908 RepID=UPI002EDB7F01
MQWAFDPAHSQIQFAVKHMGISTVRGTFDQFTGTIEEDNGVVKSVTVEVDVASLNTQNTQRDEHLRSGDFFDVANSPKATFVLTKFERSGNDVTATGDLTLRGTTKPVTLKGEIGGPAKDPWGNQKVSAELETKISRKEWGLVWNVALEAGGVLVSDEVKLRIDVQAAPAA